MIAPGAIGPRNLFPMIRFLKVFPEFEIDSALMRQLRWRPFLHIIVSRSAYCISSNSILPPPSGKGYKKYRIPLIFILFPPFIFCYGGFAYG
jgi:hypothetical protein